LAALVFWQRLHIIKRIIKVRVICHANGLNNENPIYIPLRIIYIRNKLRANKFMQLFIRDHVNIIEKNLEGMYV
jgi:hypothetical protein